MTDHYLTDLRRRQRHGDRALERARDDRERAYWQGYIDATNESVAWHALHDQQTETQE